MAFSRIGLHSGTNTTFVSTVTTDSWTSTAGNLLIAIAEADTVGEGGIIISDSKGNTWNRVLSKGIGATFDLELWYTVIKNAGAGHTVTATDNGGGVDSLIIVEEWSGNDPSPVDVYVGSIDNGGLSLNLASGNTITTSQNNELVVGAGVIAGNTTMSAGSGFSNLNKVNTTFSTLAFQSKTVSTTGVQSATMTAGAAGSWVCICATFREQNINGSTEWLLVA